MQARSVVCGMWCADVRSHAPPGGWCNDAGRLLVSGLTPPASTSWLRVEVIRAERAFFRSVRLELAPGSTLQQARDRSGLMQMAGFSGDVVGYAVHGERAVLSRSLSDGDRVELLTALLADPKQARRHRAQRAARDAAVAPGSGRR